MKYLLDTNVCIRYINGRSPSVLQRLDLLPRRDVCLCSIVRFELRYGALRSEDVEVALSQQEKFVSQFVFLPFDDESLDYAAKIRADLAKVGTPIGPYDLLIAAIALANHLTLVTHNVREFSRVAGLKIEDWEAEAT